jgi:hypothetical protein
MSSLQPPDNSAPPQVPLRTDSTVSNAEPTVSIT